jgi:hypothetical protein
MARRLGSAGFCIGTPQVQSILSQLEKKVVVQFRYDPTQKIWSEIFSLPRRLLTEILPFNMHRSCSIAKTRLRFDWRRNLRPRGDWLGRGLLQCTGTKLGTTLSRSIAYSLSDLDRYFAPEIFHWAANSCHALVAALNYPPKAHLLIFLSGLDRSFAPELFDWAMNSCRALVPF